MYRRILHSPENRYRLILTNCNYLLVRLCATVCKTHIWIYVNTTDPTVTISIYLQKSFSTIIRHNMNSSDQSYKHLLTEYYMLDAVACSAYDSV